MKRNFLIIIVLSIITFSCVPARQYEDEKAKRQSLESDLQQIQQNYTTIENKNKELEAKIAELEKEINYLKRDTLNSGIAYRKLTVEYDKLLQLYEILDEKNKELLQTNVNETQKISSELSMTKEQLEAKEAQLLKLEQELNNKKQILDNLEQELGEKEKRIIELENMLARRDSTLKDLKNKISSALFNFENKGLNVVMKNDRIYVSLEESLMFPSGSWAVDKRGEEALAQLAKVLEANPDISILVEGHTDDVPYRGRGEIKDNWDLSVMRATAVVKILLQKAKIDPSRITAAGRGEYAPVDPAKTAEARQKNRRTEIILTPNMDELLKILNTD